MPAVRAAAAEVRVGLTGVTQTPQPRASGPGPPQHLVVLSRPYSAGRAADLGR